VPAEKVDRVYVDKAYYLGPDKGGDRAYRLLSAAMQTTGLSALGRYAARGKQYLVLLSPREDGIVMEQLRYADEVRSFQDVPVGSGEVKDRELELAVQLIRQIAAEEFRPEQYRDDVRDRVMELIQRKIEGQDITETPAPQQPRQVIDLMEALKASLSKADAGSETARKAAKRAPAKAAKKTARKKAAGGS
jgi:DNA end-binding protein Ku